MNLFELNLTNTDKFNTDVLVASRRPVKRLKDLLPDEAADFFDTVLKVQKITEIYHQTMSSTVTIQDGEYAGQTVKHVHCHIMPRKEGDFEHNDEIYVKLASHDHQKEELEPRRCAEEMAKEAMEYRHLFVSMNFD